MSARRPECRGEGVEGCSEDESALPGDSGETTRAPGAPVLEQALIDRVEALTSLCERMLTTFRAIGHPRTGFEAELQDLTEEEGDT